MSFITANLTFEELLLVPLLIGILMAFVRLLRGPSLPDRVVALDLITTMGIGVAGVYAVTTGRAMLLDIAILVALISFLGTIAFAKYLEKRNLG